MKGVKKGIKLEVNMDNAKLYVLFSHFSYCRNIMAGNGYISDGKS